MLSGRDTDSGLIRPLDHAAVGANIRNAGVGVLRYDVRSGKKRTSIETGIADGHGKSEQAAVAARHFSCLENDLLDRSGLHDVGCDGMAQGPIPTLRHLPRPAFFLQA